MKIQKLILFFIAIITSIFLFTGCQNPLQRTQEAGLQVITEGENSSVFINDQYANKTPFIDKSLKPGEYTVKLIPDNQDLAEYETTVTLNSGLLTVINWKFGNTLETSGGVIYEMEKSATGKGTELSLISIPDGAVVKIDNGQQKFAPVLMENISPGAHTFQVSLPSYNEQKHSLNIVEGYRLNVTVKLAKQKNSFTAKDTKQNDEQQEATQEADTTNQQEEENETNTPTPIPSPQEQPSPTPITSNNKLEPPYITVAETGTGWLRVRSRPGLGGEEVAKIHVGDSFPYLESDQGWYKIEYEIGKEGWISNGYANLVKE